MLYEKDSIAERDTWQKMKNSVVKWWQVNYIQDVTVLEAGEEKTIRKSLRQEESSDEYNATTGAYSGSYGKVVTLDQGGLDQVASILNEKNDLIQHMFEKDGN